jgi:FkbH-like protein
MSKENVLVAGSSFLLPFHNDWRTLEKSYEVNFAEFGNVLQSLDYKNFEDVLVLVLILEDIIDFYNDDLEKIEAKLVIILESIKFRVSNSPKPTIVITISVTQQNVVDEAKFESLETATYSKFVNSLREISKEYHGLYLIDSSLLYSRQSKKVIFDNRNWYYSHSRFSVTGLSILIMGIKDVLNRIKAPSSKVLVLDCDNTLWGGVVGEDLSSGITLGEDGIGKAFQDFQKEVRRLLNRGVLICLASKNNEKEVWEVFSNHRGMILKKDDISNWRINWDTKSTNLLEMSDDLGLSLDSFVFWDDSPIEREEIRLHLPDVRVVEVPQNIEDWPEALHNLSYFTTFEITNEDLEKNEQYKKRNEFNQQIRKAIDRRSFLTSIEMEVEAHMLAPDNLRRAEQLSLKTNQFNLRKQRYSSSEIQQMKSSGQSVMELVSLRDRFGDHGIIAMYGLTKIEDDVFFINTFLLSCRAIGREIEFWIMNRIRSKCVELQGHNLYAEYVKTDKNQIANNFLENQGFMKVNEDNVIFQKLKKRQFEIDGTLYRIKLE